MYLFVQLFKSAPNKALHCIALHRNSYTVISKYRYLAIDQRQVAAGGVKRRKGPQFITRTMVGSWKFQNSAE
eukprot:COSAG02_NODE_2876_length_7843_cov_12.285382_1_plen_72_part_00